ncbi:hypothetical protein MPH_04820 [Macrophomina phaseolina MS6]|uniref:Uncharacterized protein n=1 Tax=Macrophomina phaseolina (strain MS6) TaxID=1126212 RepID=K2RT88_MACPH|nr:hypothetical protein MPH_04820 [Macrophomina phaseolina MS6]
MGISLLLPCSRCGAEVQRKMGRSSKCRRRTRLSEFAGLHDTENRRTTAQRGTARPGRFQEGNPMVLVYAEPTPEPIDVEVKYGDGRARAKTQGGWAFKACGIAGNRALRSWRRCARRAIRQPWHHLFYGPPGIGHMHKVVCGNGGWIGEVANDAA